MQGLRGHVVLGFHLGKGACGSMCKKFKRTLTGLGSTCGGSSSMSDGLGMGSVVRCRSNRDPATLFTIHSLNVSPTANGRMFLAGGKAPAFSCGTSSHIGVTSAGPGVQNMFNVSFACGGLRTDIGLHCGLNSFTFGSTLFGGMRGVSTSGVTCGRSGHTLCDE